MRNIIINYEMTGQSNKSNYDYVAVMYYILIFVYFF